MEDRQEVDLLIIIGTSLKVSPVSETICKPLHASVVRSRCSPTLPHSTPATFSATGVTLRLVLLLERVTDVGAQILINKTPIKHINPDVSL